MNQLFNLKTITQGIRNRIRPSITGEQFVISLGLALACFALLPAVQAVTPAPDGGYDSGNTAEGTDALFSWQVNASTGQNTAIGYRTLFNDSNGNENTATGAFALYANTSGSENTATGVNALTSNTTGSLNTAVGYEALNNNQTGSRNTAIGFQALLSNTADDNVAIGPFALQFNTTGTNNTAVGDGLESNKTGSSNTAIGESALLFNNADNNTATGASALRANTSGTENTATGVQSLLNNTTGSDNTAMGISALAANQTGNSNAASGADTLSSNTTGSFNTASGEKALFANTGGNNNTATGFEALNSSNANNNTATGFEALFNNTGGHDNTAGGFQALLKSTGSNNIALGSSAGTNLTTGSNNIDIGAPGTAGEANTIRIGKSGTQQKTFVAGIYGKTVASGVGIIIGSNGQLGTVQSSARFKDDIKSMDKASEALLKLKPVTFRYKEELDPDKIPQFGLIAEEVEKANPDLVVRDEEGNVTTVRYEAVNAMLLNEFLKEHRTVQELKGTVTRQAAVSAQQQLRIEKQQKEIEALTANLQKLSEQQTPDCSMASTRE